LLLSEIECSAGNRRRAILSLRQAVSINPDNAQTWSTLGTLCQLEMRWKEAASAYAEASRLDPQQPTHLTGLGLAQLAAQLYDAAQLTSDKLLKTFPSSPDAWSLAGHMRKTRGEFGAAIECYQKAFSLNPQCSSALLSLVELGGVTSLADPTVGYMLSRVGKPDLSDQEACELHFAMAKVRERCRDFERAFDHYQKANEARGRLMSGQGFTYDPVAMEASVQEKIGRYPRASFRCPIPRLHGTLTPIFIVGMPRSGTTLIEQILSQHPKVKAGGEHVGVADCYASFLRNRNRVFVSWPSNPCDPKEASLLQEAREQYLTELIASGGAEEFITDKFTGNIEHVGFIRQMFPDAPIVHCVRDPIATCWSLYTTPVLVHSSYCTNLSSLADRYAHYATLIDHWTGILTPPMIRVEYEKLVASPACEIRRLVTLCGLDWDDRCLAPHENPRFVNTASVTQVRLPVYETSVLAWRNYEAYLGALLVLRDT
jgi:tetratricopeptide (TPR) repeat protein